MTCAAIITGSWTDRERRASAIVNVMPACLACGSFFVDEVSAQIDDSRHISLETEFDDGCDYMTLWRCSVCRFVSSEPAVTS